MPSYNTVQSVEKALRLLEELNKRPVSRVKDLSRNMGLPHSTIVRLLETLSTLGYASKIDRGSGYCVTDRTERLSSGNHGFPQVLMNLKLRADRLTKKHLWPTAICTLDGDAMVVRYSTIPRSPLAHAHSTINRRLSLTGRAHGRAYLAFCPDVEKRHLLELIDSMPGLPEDYSRDALEQELTSIKISGFAGRSGRLKDQTNTIAVPYWRAGRLVATIGFTYFIRSVPDPTELALALKRVAAKT